MNDKILMATDKKEEKFLRTKTADFDFSKFTKKEINDLIAAMKRIMRAANGIGLSANQIGLPYKMFLAEVPDKQGGNKFYAIFNPRIEKTGGEKTLLEEGCLSIPGKFGDVLRFERVTLVGKDKNDKAVKIKAWGLLAHVFQHETDHLAGTLYIDKAKNIRETPATERLVEREEKVR